MSETATTCKTLSIEEYNTHIKTLNFYDTTRNTLLTFSFTAVLTLLGVIVGAKQPINPYICLIPYMLIIPFAARISYYRLASARINTFLKHCAPEKTIMANGSEDVPERNGRIFGIISWLVNHEMVLLAVATGLVYAIQYFMSNELNTWWKWVQLFWPVPAIVATYVIASSTYSYKKLCDFYDPKWKHYLEKEG